MRIFTDQEENDDSLRNLNSQDKSQVGKEKLIENFKLICNELKKLKNRIESYLLEDNSRKHFPAIFEVTIYSNKIN